MTDQTQETQEVQESKVETFKAVVTNEVNGVTGELFSREVPFDKKDLAMKGVRQRIRDLGLMIDGERATIRQANVEDVQVGTLLTKTIIFTEAVVTNEKAPVGTGRANPSNARKNAADTEQNETDAELLGIALDADVPEEDAREALMKYPRHHLIHAVNTSLDEGEEKLHHFSTKAQAVEALLAKATVEVDEDS